MLMAVRLVKNMLMICQDSCEDSCEDSKICFLLLAVLKHSIALLATLQCHGLDSPVAYKLTLQLH